MVPCIIPARGGSKGIPRKNLVNVCGRPLIGWTIQQAVSSRHIDEVVVATDDDDIARMAAIYGAKVFDRSPETATDDATSEAVLREVVLARYSSVPYFVFLQATSPCRQPGAIDAAIELFREHDADGVFSARRVHGYTWRRNGGVTTPYQLSRPMRQNDAVERLEENGSIYVIRTQTLIERHARHGENPVPYIQHPLDGYQIDEPEDIRLMEEVMQLRMPSLTYRQWPI